MPFSSPELPTASAFPQGLIRPSTLDLHFEGFSEQAFSTLAALRAHPHIAQYRALKGDIDRYVTAPFKRYRDDLVLGWVLPNTLPFETEKNVFSRLLKNDFGAGGAHHHLWMAFYRLGSKRLHDAQLSHSIDPDGFSVGLYVGDYAQAWVRNLRQRVLEEGTAFYRLLEDILADPAWRAFVYTGAGEKRVELVRDSPPDHAAVGKARGFWVRRTFASADVLAWGPRLVAHALGALETLWPLYLYFLEAAPDRTA